MKRILGVVFGQCALLALISLAAPPAVGQTSEVASRVNASRLPASTLLVTNDAELRGAARLSATTDINILIDRTIVSKGSVMFPKSNSVVRILGVNDAAEIKFDMKFDGNWNDPAFRPKNGISFYCRQAYVRGVTFSGFEWLGAAIKGHVSRLLDISDCQFNDIGTIQFPHKKKPPESAEDTLYNQAISAHGLTTTNVSIRNCEFTRCALNNHRWSHCIYVSASAVTVSDNSFAHCGNPFAIGGGPRGCESTVCGNTITDPHPVEDAYGVVRPPYLGSVKADSPAVFAFNRVEGEYSSPWTGQPDPKIHLIDFNEYSGMSFRRSWASHTGRGVSMSFEQWRELGFDVHSSAPRSSRAKRERQPK